MRTWKERLVDGIATVLVFALLTALVAYAVRTREGTERECVKAAPRDSTWRASVLACKGNFTERGQ